MNVFFSLVLFKRIDLDFNLNLAKNKIENNEKLNNCKQPCSFQSAQLYIICFPQNNKLSYLNWTV